MGGALAMNAGCYGSETWQHVERVLMVERSGEIRARARDVAHVEQHEARARQLLVAAQHEALDVGELERHRALGGGKSSASHSAAS